MDHHHTPHDVVVDEIDHLIETAELFGTQGRFSEAAEYLQAALRTAQATGDTRKVMEVLDQITYAQRLGGRAEDALATARSFMAVADSLGCNIDRAQARFRFLEAVVSDPDVIELDPSTVLSEIDRLMEPLLDEPSPAHAIRRHTIEAALLGAKGESLEAAARWSEVADIAAAVGRRSDAFDCRANEVRCRVNCDDIAGADRVYRTLLTTTDVGGRPELTEWVILTGVEHFLLKQDEAFWAEVDSDVASRHGFDLRSCLETREEVFAPATSGRRRAHFLVLRALAVIDDEPETARGWLEEAVDLASVDTDKPKWDAYVRGLIDLCRAELAVAAGDCDEAVRSYSASAVHLVRARATVLAHRAADRVAELGRVGTSTTGDDR